jgi:phospholipid N-methyltransferase
MQNPIFKRFLCHPTQVGALCSSSPALGRKITSDIGLETAKTVVELGPGAGAITREILGKVSRDAFFLAVELDKMLYDELELRFPAVSFRNDSAVNLAVILASEQRARADVIISGLPWAIFPESLQEAILDSITDSLAADGCFTTFAYVQGLLLPAGRRFRRRLQERFELVEVSEVVWRNLPPAFVYRCRNCATK